MSKGDYNPSDYSKYDNLVYFRWKALIRCPQYQEFYFSRSADIEKAQEKDSVESEISDRERRLGTVEADGSFDAPSLTDFLDSVKQYGLPIGTRSSEIEEYEALLSELNDIEETEEEILAEANEKFGIIASDIEDLKPLDKHIQSLYLTFQDYLSIIPPEYRSMFTGIIERTGAVRELKQDGLSGLEPYLKSGEYRLLLVNTHMPKSLIYKSFQDHFTGHAVKKSERKDFESWKEAFEVWDMNHKLKAEGVENHLIATATGMRERYPTNALWQEGQYKTKQNLKTRVNDKLKVAVSLIDLAGKGTFKPL